MATPRDLAQDMVGWLDGRAVSSIYAAVSVQTERMRRRLRREGRPFFDPGSEARPDPREVDATAAWVASQYRFGVAAMSGVAGLGGMASVPPEVLGTIIAVVRLAQRLAIVYGFDPETDHGQMVVWQALSAGLEVDLPEGGPMGFRVRDLPGVVGSREPQAASVALARAVVRRSALMVVGRLTRLVPVVAAGSSALASRERIRRVSERMVAVYRRLAEPDWPDPQRVVDAVEV